MTAWVTPDTWQTGEVIDATRLNNIRDDLNHLKNGRSYGNFQFAGNYTTTSTTFTNVDGTNLSFSITTDKDNTRILIVLTAAAYNSAADTIYLTVTVGGVNIGDASTGILRLNSGSTSADPVTVAMIYNVATAGTNAVNLQWRNAAGVTSTLLGAGSYFGVTEIG